MAGRAYYKTKIQREYESFVKEPPPGMVLNSFQDEPNRTIWIINMQGVQGTLYGGDQFQLQIKFGANYPFEPPKVIFVGQNIPIHPYVYADGNICLSILAEEWSPALSIQSVCLSIQSMLSSCKDKKTKFEVLNIH